MSASKEETRLQILHVALQLFAQKGFGNTSMNDIVRETGLSKGGIYWHFSSRDEIVEAVFDEYFQGQIAALVVSKAEDEAVGVRIRKLVKLIADALTETKQLFPEPLEFYAYALRQENLLNRLRNYFTTYTTHLAELIQQGINQGEFNPVNADETAHILASALEGVILISALTASGHTLQTRLTTTAELILTALESPPQL